MAVTTEKTLDFLLFTAVTMGWRLCIFEPIKVRAIPFPLLIHHTAHRIKGAIREVTMGWRLCIFEPIKVRRAAPGAHKGPRAPARGSSCFLWRSV